MNSQIKLLKNLTEDIAIIKDDCRTPKIGDIGDVVEFVPNGNNGPELKVAFGPSIYKVPYSTDTVELLPESMNITLVSATSDPIETIYVVWYGSRHTDKITVDEVKTRMESDPEFKAEVFKTMDLIAGSQLPVGEFITFNFECDEVAIYWYDQLVRTRLQSIWSQTTRNVALGDYRPYIPTSVKSNSVAYGIWMDHHKSTKDTIEKLLELGIPPEDANRLAPTARTRRTYWSIDFANLKRITNTRGCWIAQSDVWLPAIVSIVTAIRKYNPILADYIGGTPCNFTGKCKFSIENAARLSGDDCLPVCPLYCRSNNIKYPSSTYQDSVQFEVMKSNYSELWGKDRLSKLME